MTAPRNLRQPQARGRGYIPGGYNEEHALHRKFSGFRARNPGEWFHYRDELREYVEGLE